MTLQSTRLRLTQAIYFGKPTGAAPILTGYVKRDGSAALTNNWNAGNFNVTSANSTDYVNVATKATGGSGSSISPWTGWNTAITWAQGTTYYFQAGYFGITSAAAAGVLATAWSTLNNIRLVGDDDTQTFLVYSGGAITNAWDLSSVSVPRWQVENI